MSQTKAQLIQPIGVVTASGVVVSGVMTAATFDGDIVGSATSIIQGTNLNLGAFNATSFAGDFTGNATGIITSSAIKVGQLTASSFVGDFTGTATSMMRGTGFEAGAVTGSSFVADVTGNVTGNATGLAGSVTQGTNIHVGVITATSLYGDGSNLTGIAATNWNTQTVTANSGATTIDLSAGNMITFNQSATTVVSLANTSTSMDITIIRDNGSGDITWPSSIKWNGGSDPTLNNDTYSNDFNQFQLLTRDGGLTWYGWESAGFAGGRELWMWGQSDNGSLGLNEPSPTSYSSPTQMTGAASWNALTSDSAGPGERYGGATKSDNTMWIWGSNSYGQLGQNDRTKRSSPIQIPGTTWTCDRDKFSAGPSKALAIKTDGTLWSWGYNSIGGLGLNNNGVAYSSPTQVGTDTTWSICNKNEHAAAIKTDGTLWVWGTNKRGCLGQNNQGSHPTYLTAQSSPTQVGSGTNWKYVDCGNTYTFATKTDGTFWSWGYNAQGQLGVSDTTSRSSPIQVPGTNWNRAYCIGGAFTGGGLAIKTDGTLWSWGTNNTGRLGQNNEVGSSSPKQVGTNTTWSDLITLDLYSVGAIKTDGTIWAWGDNTYGQLGQNNTSPVKYSSPTQIGADTTWSSIGSFGNNMLAMKT